MIKTTSAPIAACLVLGLAVLAAPSARAQTGWGSGTMTATATGSNAVGTQGTQGSDGMASAGCDQEIAQSIDAAKRAEILQRVAIAGHNYSKLPPGGHRAMSCLSDLMSTLLTGSIFLPNISTIMSMLGNAVCNLAQQEGSRALQSTMTSMGLGGAGSGGASMNLGQLIPGVNLGTVGFGFGQGSGGLGLSDLYGVATGSTSLGQVAGRTTNIYSLMQQAQMPSSGMQGFQLFSR